MFNRDLAILSLGSYALAPQVRILAIGDIHGCRVALTTLLRQIEPRDEDQIVFLGDYIDRGPESREVVESMLQLRRICSPVFLRGNHEVMILDARDDALKANLWQSYGGFEALISYGAEHNPNWPTLIPKTHWDFFTQTVRCFETKDHIFVHACLDPDAGMDEQPDWLLFWESLDHLKPHKSGKRIICGHSTQSSGHALNLGFAVCIDTGPNAGGWLTCLDVHSGQLWQANECGESRTGSLPGHS